MAETLDVSHVSHHPTAEGGAVLMVEHLQDASAYGCHIYIGRAFSMTAFASEAAI